MKCGWFYRIWFIASLYCCRKSRPSNFWRNGGNIWSNKKLRKRFTCLPPLTSHYLATTPSRNYRLCKCVCICSDVIIKLFSRPLLIILPLLIFADLYNGRWYKHILKICTERFIKSFLCGYDILILRVIWCSLIYIDILMT